MFVRTRHGEAPILQALQMKRKLTQQQKTAFRTEFIAAAEKLFATHGVAGVTMRQIAQAVGYSQTAAYSYFKNKDEILAEVRAAAVHRFCDRLEAACGKRDARANARAIGAAYLDFAAREAESYKLIFNTDQPEAWSFPNFARAVARAKKCMTTYVQALIDAGELEGDAGKVGEIFWAAAHGVVMLHYSGLIGSVAMRNRLHREMLRMLAHGAGMA